MGTNGKKTLAQLIREFFVGPVKVMAERLEGTPAGITYKPVDKAAASELRDLLGLRPNQAPMLFGVAAFRGKEGEDYDVYARLRGNIVELLPVFKLGIREQGVWKPETMTNPFELELELKNGHWGGRHPETGQHIRLVDMDLTPNAEGKAHVHPGELVLRPAVTRTFWLLGQAGVVGELSDNAIETYDAEQEEDFSYAPYFRIMGRWRSPWECIGDPTFGGIVVLEQVEHAEPKPKRRHRKAEEQPAPKPPTTHEVFEQELEAMIERFDLWRRKVLVPTIHPDRLLNPSVLTVSDEKLEELQRIADETRHQSLLMVEWLRRWAKHFVADLRLRRSLGIPPNRNLPQPLPMPGRNKPLKELLVDLKAEDIVRILMKPARDPIRVTRKPAEPKKTATSNRRAPAPEERQQELARRKTRKRKPEPETVIELTPSATGEGTVIGDLIPASVKQALEDKVNGNGRHSTDADGSAEHQAGITEADEALAAAQAALAEVDTPRARRQRRKKAEVAKTE